MWVHQYFRSHIRQALVRYSSSQRWSIVRSVPWQTLKQNEQDINPNLSFFHWLQGVLNLVLRQHLMKWQNEKVGNRFHCSFFLYHPVVTYARGMCLRRCFSLSNSQKLWLCMEDILANEQGWDHRIIRLERSSGGLWSNLLFTAGSASGWTWQLRASPMQGLKTSRQGDAASLSSLLHCFTYCAYKSPHWSTLRGKLFYLCSRGISPQVMLLSPEDV